MSDVKTLALIENLPSNTSNSVDAYISKVNRIPLLTLEEEVDLGNKLQQAGDVVAAEKLVSAHLRYVVKVARSYMGYGLQLGDLIQEGTIGLMKAVKRFQPNKGVRLVTFAVHWIKAEIHEYILRNWRIVKIATTKAQRKLFFNLRSTKKRIGHWFTPKEVEYVAKDLGVKPKDVIEMEMRLNAHDAPFDLPATSESPEQKALPAPIEVLETPNADPSLILEQQHWQSFAQDKLYQALDKLDKRSKQIIELRWLQNKEKVTLRNLADKYKISIERVRQIESNALKKLQNLMQQVKSAGN